jgi:hypothetical protein
MRLTPLIRRPPGSGSFFVQWRHESPLSSSPKKCA